MATKSPSSSTAAVKKQSVKPGQAPTSPTPGGSKKKSVKPGEVAPPLLDPDATKLLLKPGDEIVPDPTPSPPPLFRPWLRKIRPPWELPPKQPRPQPRWRIPNPKMLRKFKLPAQVEFQDARWTRTMLDITMKKKYPKAVRMHLGPVDVTHELHDGPVQVYLQPLAKEMRNYPECQNPQFSTTKPF